MKTRLLLTLIITIVTIGLGAQTQFENPGFEEWEDIQYGSVQEPVNWSSIRSATPDEMAQLAPATWGMSDDAHSGNHSVYLENISVFGIVATGMVTNGRVLANLQTDLANSHTVPEDPKWHCPITSRPDSVVGWYKGNPTEGDFPTAKVLLHTGYASLPQDDSSTWIGVAYIELSPTEVNTWTRFSMPFEYFNENIPEFALTILTAGNGLDAIGGSEAWFDDVSFIYNETSIREQVGNNLEVYYSGDNLNVFIDEPSRVTRKINVTDLSGKQVFAGEITTGEKHQFQLNVKKGFYIVSVHSESGIQTKKVFIQ